MSQVSVLMGSDSDFVIMSKAVDILKQFDVTYEVAVASAHRTPDLVAELVRSAPERGVSVFIAGAGMAAALPGVVAAYTTLPVIGVPLSGSALQGTDALYAIVQMPPGIPVATVGIDAATNAGLLAVQLLALSNTDLAERLVAYRRNMATGVLEKSRAIQEKST
ncbi:MAG: 5-(carboxyamino)imidazole ribonucleotide mutase [candidate division WS1 bacterium]|nr:5-(carboxyamino)imidazole ribonucleotide mutase [candidate division WS1 bacterium]